MIHVNSRSVAKPKIDSGSLCKDAPEIQGVQSQCITVFPTNAGRYKISHLPLKQKNVNMYVKISWKSK